MTSEQVAQPPARRVRGRFWWAPKLALAGLSLLVALLVGELVARRAKTAAGQPQNPWSTVRALWMLANGMSADLTGGEVVMRGSLGTARVMLHPYLGFDASSGLDQYSTDLALFQQPEAKEIFDVLILGGSVAS